MGALTENHRCPRGPFHRLIDALSTVAVGASIGIAVLYTVFNEQPVPALVLAAAALGAVLTSAVRQAVNGR
jgi:hypothetical protein